MLGRRAANLGTFESLRRPAFRLFFFATLAQFAGMNAQQLARAYLIFDLTESYTLLAGVALAGALPNLVFSLLGGVLADRASKKLLLQIGQVGNAAIAISVGTVLAFGALEAWHLIVAAVAQGMVVSMSLPARQAIIPEIVGERRLMNAVSLNTAGMTMTRLTAPGVAGLIIAVVGAASLYFLMTGLFTLAVLFTARLPYEHRPVDRSSSAGQSLRDLGAGFTYIARERAVLLVLLLNLVMVMFSFPLLLLIAGFAEDVLGAGAFGLGLLLSIMGLGSLLGSLAIASLPPRRRGLLLIASAMLLGVSLLAFAASDVYWLSALIVVAFGVGHAGRMTLSNTLLLSYVDEALRGRVMSLYMMEFGIAQFGVFGIGLLAAAIGPQAAFAASALVLIVLAGGAYLFVPRLRHLE